MDEEALLRKRAEGYNYEEVTEEYVADDGEMRLVRKKVSTKYAPPDLAAIKALEEREPDVERMTDAELEALRARLVRERAAQRNKANKAARTAAADGPDGASGED